MAETPLTARHQALALLSQSQFHRKFKLPATANHEELSITYSDTGAARDTSEEQSNAPALLFIPGQFATRYLGAIYLHNIAATIGVRCLVVDRPGMGDSTPVPVHQRVSIWIETVRALLQHLRIKHVALVSHSAGAIYMLNTIFHCPDLLHPRQPYVAFLAPWIDPAHSQVTAMQAIQLLPKQLFSYWGQTARVFVQKSGPAIYASGVVLQKARNLLPGTTTEDSSFIGKSRRRLEEEYDLAVDVQMELEKYGFQMAFEESVEGANSEALICMKKCPEGAWGECEDYGRFVREFAGMQRQRIVQPPSHGQSQEGGWGKLKVEAYFATSDIMIGKKGQRYFEDCWRGKGLEEDFSDLWSFDSVTIEGANHETVCSAVEVLERVFQQVKLSCIEGAN